jgi:molecular chaperone HtpG
MRLREILRKYSDHITVPIVMKKEKWDSDAKKQVLTDEDEQVNQASALWARPKSEITEEQYHEFYKHVAHDLRAAARVRAREGRRTSRVHTALLHPAARPFDLWDREHRHGIKLYVRRVFIMDDAEDLMPPYLRFVRGIIDSSDLPLNVSREILQQSRDVQQMKGASAKRVLGLLEDLAAKQADTVRDLLEDLRSRPQGGHRRRLGQSRAESRSCCDSRRRHEETEEQKVSLG